MKKFPLQYANRCSECGEKIAVGTHAYGEKDDSINKWVIVCVGCYKASGDPNLKKPKKAEIDGTEFKNYLDMISKDKLEKYEDASVTTIKQAVAPTALELIRKNAQYGGA